MCVCVCACVSERERVCVCERESVEGGTVIYWDMTGDRDMTDAKIKHTPSPLPATIPQNSHKDPLRIYH